MKSKYKIQYLSDGWPGQIKRLSLKTSESEVYIFKRISIEAIVIDGYDKEVTLEIKSRLENIIFNLIESPQYPFDNSRWEEEWHLLAFTNEKWFKDSWSKNEFDIIKSINTEFSNRNCFKRLVPTESLLSLKKKFIEINRC